MKNKAQKNKKSTAKNQNRHTLYDTPFNVYFRKL
ncbi:MAG: hypothetical protein XD95_0176, partial [Microgenomates bacterium 39_7]